MAYFCISNALSRHMIGRFYYPLAAYVPAGLAAAIALLVERKSRCAHYNAFAVKQSYLYILRRGPLTGYALTLVSIYR